MDPHEDAANDVGGRAAGVLLLAGLGMCGSTLLPWTRLSARQGSLWEVSSATDVSVAALGSAAVVLACVVLVSGGCRAFLVAGAGAAALTAGPWAGEFVVAHSRDGDVFAYEGPTIAVGCAIVLLAGALLCVRGAGRVELGSSRPVLLGRVALVAAGVATPALPLVAGVGGPSLYESSSVIDVALIVLAGLVLFSALLLSRHHLMTWVAIIAGAGLTGLAYATGLELLLVEQDFLSDTDGTGLALAFIAAPLAGVGTVLLAAAADEAASRAVRARRMGDPPVGWAS